MYNPPEFHHYPEYTGNIKPSKLTPNIKENLYLEKLIQISSLQSLVNRNMDKDRKSLIE